MSAVAARDGWGTASFRRPTPFTARNGLASTKNRDVAVRTMIEVYYGLGVRTLTARMQHGAVSLGTIGSASRADCVRHQPPIVSRRASETPTRRAV